MSTTRDAHGTERFTQPDGTPGDWLGASSKPSMFRTDDLPPYDERMPRQRRDLPNRWTRVYLDGRRITWDEYHALPLMDVFVRVDMKQSPWEAILFFAWAIPLFMLAVVVLWYYAGILATVFGWIQPFVGDFVASCAVLAIWFGTLIVVCEVIGYLRRWRSSP